MPVTSGDRILIHILSRGEPDGWSGGVTDQDMISDHTGIGRTHVPRSLRPLIESGFVKEELGRVPGRPRRVKVYSLTIDGFNAAREAMSRCRLEMVEWTDDEGRMREGSVSDSLREVNDRLRSLSMRTIPLALFLSLDIEKTIKWNDLLWIAASLGKESEGPSVPKGWKPTDHDDVPVGIEFDRNLMDGIDTLLEKDGILVIKGERGSGKKDLIRIWSLSRSKKILWLEKGDNEGACLDEGPWDIMVLIGGGDPQVEDLLQEGGSWKDPRNEEWPEELSKMDIILTTEADVEMKGPMLKIEGVTRNSFIRSATDLGMSKDLAEEAYMASCGSPDVLRYVSSISENQVRELNDSDLESAIISILMRSKR
jgi:hypothetical protein